MLLLSAALLTARLVQVRNSCRDKHLLALDLLPIACQRVNQIVPLEKAAVDPLALQWMQASVSRLQLPAAPASTVNVRPQDCKQTVTSAARQATELLLEFVMANLPDGSQALKVANSLLQTMHLAMEQ